MAYQYMPKIFHDPHKNPPPPPPPPPTYLMYDPLHAVTSCILYVNDMLQALYCDLFIYADN